MKYYTASTIFKYTWDQVASGFWCRYPNPQSMHVLSEDVIHQSISDGKLITKKLLTKTGSLTKCLERFVSGPKYVYVVEESIVDPASKTLTTYTRNITYTSLMTVEEKCVYKFHEENNDWTECQRQAYISGNMWVVAYAGLKFKKNIDKTVKGFNYVLNLLYPHVIPNPTPTGKHKLKDTAEAAKKLASTVVTVTN